MSNKKPTKKKKQPNKNKKDLSVVLNDIYTKDINLDTTCNHRCECCKVAMPQIYYSEFLNIVTHVWNNSEKEEKLNIICTSIEYFFRYEYEKWGMEKLIKPCVFLDTKGMCSIYEKRPLNCLLPDTLVLTNCGVKKVKDILAGDYVVGEDGQYHIVVGTMSKYYNGCVYTIRPQGVNFDVTTTSEHLWKVVKQKDKRKKPSPYWEQAKNLIGKKSKKSGHYLVFPQQIQNREKIEQIVCKDYIAAKNEDGRMFPFTNGGKLFEGKSLQSIPSTIDVNDEFLFMLGIYLAEGQSSDQSTSFCMNKQERRHLDRINNYLEGLGIPTHYNKENPNNKNLVLRVDSCLFARLMKKLGGSYAYGKKINDDLFLSLDHESLYKIYSAWDIGDGKKSKTMERSTITISKDLAAQMYYVLLCNKTFSRVYKNKRSDRGYSNYDLHVFPSSAGVLPIKGQGTKMLTWDGDQNFYMPLEEVQVSTYAGPVIDIQVEGAESFVTTSGVVHNCKMYGLWPEEDYNKRVDNFAKRYAKYGLSREELPLYKQCPFVKRVDDNVELTSEVIDALYKRIDNLDKEIGDFTDLQIENKENYRTFHDWLLLRIFGETWLTQLTAFILAADKETLKDQITQIKVAVCDAFSKDMPKLELILPNK